LRICVCLGYLSVMGRTLSSRPWSFSEWVPETITQAGEAKVNRCLVSAVYRFSAQSLNLIRGVTLISVLKALVSAVHIWIPLNLSIKEYTEIFRIFYKPNVPPFQCEGRLCWCARAVPEERHTLTLNTLKVTSRIRLLIFI
jgi:hypothetical protein